MIAIQHGVCFAPKEGEMECGDRFIIKKEKNQYLIGAMDGLGHGPMAAQAAMEACEILAAENEKSLPALFTICHDNLKKTRGVVLTLAHLNNTSLTWLGVGNITGILWGDTKQLLLTNGGIVGGRLPRLDPSEIKLNIGDTLILASDGIKEDLLALEPMRGIDPQMIAEIIFNKYRNPNDDALILAIRILSEGHQHV